MRRCFCSGVTRPKTVVRSAAAAQPASSSGMSGPASAALGPRHAGRQRDRLDRLDPVARDHLQVDALRGQERHGADRLLAQALHEQGDADRLQAGRQRLAVERPRRAGEQHDPAPLARGAGDRLPQRLRQRHAGALQDVGRAEHERPAVRRAGRRSTCAPRRTAPRRRRARPRPGCRRRWPASCCCARPRSRPALRAGRGSVLVVARRRLDRLQADAVVGERPGLVEADRVHAGQALDGVQPLGERTEARRAARRRPRR